ncbi:MAG: PTS sugar transporter subunit IIA [Planctomycetes bacterium]|nr:PTS sugar transporter subunit IIA [Planctomycetota bacterium]
MDLTPKDAANLLKIPVETVYDWVRKGTLPSYRVGDRYRLNRVELLEWATARGMKLSPELFGRKGAPSPDLLLTDALRRGGVFHELPCADKRSALRSICDLLVLPDSVDRNDLHEVLVAREALCSTGIGEGIAIPHPRGPIVLGISHPSVTLFFLQRSIEFGALDGKPVQVLFVILSTTVHVHLTMLSHLMFALQKPEFRRLLDTRAPQPRLLDALEAIEQDMAPPPPAPSEGPTR